MDNKYKPERIVHEHLANAVYNVARELSRLAYAHNQLFYALRYSHEEGLSVAEAIEASAQKLGEGVLMGLENADKVVSSAMAEIKNTKRPAKKTERKTKTARRSAK